MSAYCNITDTKATVSYNINGADSKYISQFPPINIETKSWGTNVIPGDRWNTIVWGLQPPGYKFFRSEAKLTIKTPCFNEGYISVLVLSNDERIEFIGNNACSVNLEYVDASIEITDRFGAKFQRFGGQKPPTYEVVCGDGCPPGQHKVTIPEYPGYCCIDCASLAGEVRSIRNMVKSL